MPESPRNRNMGNHLAEYSVSQNAVHEPAASLRGDAGRPFCFQNFLSYIPDPSPPLSSLKLSLIILFQHIVQNSLADFNQRFLPCDLSNLNSLLSDFSCI